MQDRDIINSNYYDPVTKRHICLECSTYHYYTYFKQHLKTHDLTSEEYYQKWISKLDNSFKEKLKIFSSQQRDIRLLKWKEQNNIDIGIIYIFIINNTLKIEILPLNVKTCDLKIVYKKEGYIKQLMEIEDFCLNYSNDILKEELNQIYSNENRGIQFLQEFIDIIKYHLSNDYPISIWDFDGCASEGFNLSKKYDIVITGRPFEECEFVYKTLEEINGFIPPVFFNPVPLEKRGTGTKESRDFSSRHKVNIIFSLGKFNKISSIYEDDIRQKTYMEDQLGILGQKIILLYNKKESY